MLEEEKIIISDNIKRIREEVEEHRDRSLYDGDITIMCATKTVDFEKIKFAVECCGINAIGENRVNEFMQKYELFSTLNCQKHFIGTLQSNKVKYIFDKVDLIHSVDSQSLAAEINKRALKAGIICDILLEVNSGNEPQKGGFDVCKIKEEYEIISSFSNINVKGLMTMAPKCEKSSEYTKYFSQIYEIFIDIFAKKKDNINVPILSMGMSDSYIEAVKCGATIIRPGRAIFGKRN